jgi:hypothetical protein
MATKKLTRKHCISMKSHGRLMDGHEPLTDDHEPFTDAREPFTPLASSCACARLSSKCIQASQAKDDCVSYRPFIQGVTRLIC